MRKDRVRENESLRALSMRLNVPACMLMRANRMFSPSWLIPGREVDVPEGDFCLADEFICPLRAFSRPAGEAIPEDK